MRIIDSKCPNCGASFNLPEDGRLSFFCSYCGNSIILEKDPDVDDLLRIKEMDLRMKEADVRIKTEDVRLQMAAADLHKHHMNASERRARRRIGVGLLAVTVLLAMAMVALMIVTDKSFMEIGWFWFIVLILLSMSMIFFVDDESDEEKAAKKNALKQELKELREEMEHQHLIVSQNQYSLWGAGLRAKREAQSRIKELKKEIKDIQDKL